jgi:predicted 2-oxoglutarate/Fe(II)-dependent dioxygenase YbiX
MLPNAELLYPGIIVYRNVFSGLNVIDRLEEVLSDNKYEENWAEAATGYSTIDKSYRDCWDYHIKKNIKEDDGKPESQLKLESIWQDCKDAQFAAVEDYRAMFHLPPFGYWESFNFIKYGPGQHFQVHSDHGYSYICVLSSVGYINDDYDGGELYFDKLNLTIKPKAGDLYLFPSSYIYSHAAMPVTNGVKYSVVTMLDYLIAPHSPEYRAIEEKYKIIKE